MDSPKALHFVLGNHDTHWRDLEGLAEAAIDREPGRFVGGRNSWVAQTYLRLREALRSRGWTVSAGSGFRPGAIAVVHRDDANEFCSTRHSSFLVVVRADRAPVAACDLAVVQNRQDLASHERFVPLWPQPGLRGRDRARGAAIRRIAYHGRTGSLPQWFGDAAFGRALEARGIEFAVARTGWEDYRDVDISLSARDESEALSVLATKPATKIYNAWLAGVPVLAAPEPAYREIRRSAIDFIEIAGPGDVLRSLDLLRANPRLFQAMVDNGLRRGSEFSVEATRTRWMRFLEEDVARAFAAKRERLGSRGFWHWRVMAAQKALSRAHRVRTAYERWTGAAWPLPRARRRAAASGQRAPDHLADVSG
ncbi:MAG TPA: hypothetical protein VH301_17715 [Usitatibacter sp.]|nr:hypothetical protein [Usitatibacter sp.]